MRLPSLVERGDWDPIGWWGHCHHHRGYLHTPSSLSVGSGVHAGGDASSFTVSLRCLLLLPLLFDDTGSPCLPNVGSGGRSFPLSLQEGGTWNPRVAPHSHAADPTGTSTPVLLNGGVESLSASSVISRLILPLSLGINTALTPQTRLFLPFLAESSLSPPLA